MPRKKILDAFKNMEKEEKENNKEKTGAIKKATLKTSEGDKDKAVDNSSTNVVEGVKIPKKRGRKKKIVSESELAVEKIPKKRGRKPKIKPENSEDNPPKVLKKRGRKPKEKYGYVTPVIPDVATDEENIILHLPVNTQMLENERTFSENDILEYNPEIKEPSPWSENSHFQSPFETLTSHNNSKDKSNYDTIPEDHVAENSNVTEDVKLKESVSETIGDGGVNGVGGHDGNGEVAGNGGNSGSLIDQTSGYNPNLEYDLGDKDKIKSLGEVHKFATSDKHKRSFEVKDGSHLLGKQQTFSTLPTFKETNKKREIPTRTSIYCWWCCHSFDNEPCVLPTNLVGTPGNEEFQVTGCFCCPECVAAYNHECYRQHEEREQYSLLNMLYKRFYQSEQIPIKLAPPKMCLRIFGGNLSIEEFRENCHNYYQEFTVIQPPMVSIIPQIEENQANIVLKKQKFIPLDKNRIEKANEDLRLQRSKPLSESINTLENCMRLSYQRDEES